MATLWNIVLNVCGTIAIAFSLLMIFLLSRLLYRRRKRH